MKIEPSDRRESLPEKLGWEKIGDRRQPSIFRRGEAAVRFVKRGINVTLDADRVSIVDADLVSFRVAGIPGVCYDDVIDAHPPGTNHVSHLCSGPISGVGKNSIDPHAPYYSKIAKRLRRENRSVV